MNEWIFADSQSRKWSMADMTEKLIEVGAGDCQILFVHTDILFGRINPDLGRKGYLRALYEALLSLQVPTLLFPAFSYSFANHEDFDVRNTRTTMGALIEYIRKQPEAIRSLDPLLSMIAIGERTDLMEGFPGQHCFGPDSGFDRLHHQSGVKFLFFGATFEEYFTYIHYIEKVMDVPYRFDMSFCGNITDWERKTFSHTHSIHTQCGGVKLKNFLQLKEDLQKKGMLKVAPLGDLEVACIAEQDIYNEVTQRLKANPFSFVYPYDEKALTHEYTFGKNGELVTHC